MTAVTDLIDWLKTLEKGSSVAIDEGGLTLVEINSEGKKTEAYLEVGGEPRDEACCSCDAHVAHEDKYFSTPCGTYCEGCMEKHLKDCDICRSVFA
jgi:hypothetical protein